MSSVNKRVKFWKAIDDLLHGKPKEIRDSVEMDEEFQMAAAEHDITRATQAAERILSRESKKR